MADNSKKVPVSLGGISFDCTVSRSVSFSAEVPQYPVEDGFPVSDTIIRSPIQLDCTAIITETPVTWKSKHAGLGRVQEISDKLEQLFFSGQLVTFVTPDKTYENMAITSLSISKGDFLNSVEVTFSLMQITITNAGTNQSDEYEQGGDSGSDSGTTGTTEEKSEEKKGSLLSRLFGWLLG